MTYRSVNRGLVKVVIKSRGIRIFLKDKINYPHVSSIPYNCIIPTILIESHFVKWSQSFQRGVYRFSAVIGDINKFYGMAWRRRQSCIDYSI
jgi:hypothetical protein